jgi:hypothetical protein
MKRSASIADRFARLPKRTEHCILEEGDIRARPLDGSMECRSQWCRVHGNANRSWYRLIQKIEKFLGADTEVEAGLLDRRFVALLHRLHSDLSERSVNLLSHTFLLPADGL